LVSGAGHLALTLYIMETIIQKPQVALVIGSGGVKCAAAIGLWQVLQREGIEIDLAVGCSGGSMYAAMLALGHDIEFVQAMTLNFWTEDLMAGYTSNLKAATSGAVRFDERSGLVDDQPVMIRLQKAFGDQTFADTRIPLFIASTDFYSGENVVHSSGLLVDAIRASIAVPTIFPPWEIDGRLLIDGAASNPLPVDVAIREGGQVILAMGFTLATRSRMRSMTAVNAHLNALYMNNLLQAQYAFHNLAHHGEIILIMPEFEKRISTFDAHQLPAIIAEGSRAAESQLPYLRRLLRRQG
jgi:NTE family protein